MIQSRFEMEEHTARVLAAKIALLKTNPYRYKQIRAKQLLLRIRVKDRRKEKRIIYTVEKYKVKLICILDRKKEYRDMHKYIKSNSQG